MSARGIRLIPPYVGSGVVLTGSSRVAQEFLKRGLQTMVFANSRLHTELLLTYLQQANPAKSDGSQAVRAYTM